MMRKLTNMKKRYLLPLVMILVLACVLPVQAGSYMVYNNTEGLKEGETGSLRIDFNEEDLEAVTYKRVQLYSYKNKKISGITGFLQEVTYTTQLPDNQPVLFRFRRMKADQSGFLPWNKLYILVNYASIKKSLSGSTGSYAVTLKLPKVKYVKNYIVKISKKSGSGFKKAGVVKNGGKIAITSVKGQPLAENTNYFLSVIPVLKNGNKAMAISSNFVINT